MPDFNIELSLEKPVIGIDEVGRGPIAGPVVSCACIFLDYSINQSQLLFFDDSKKLSLQRRKRAFNFANQLRINNKLQYAIGVASVDEIDSLNTVSYTHLTLPTKA